MARIEYRIDGGSWTEYTGPFRVFGPGERTIEYRAVDNNGNIEETNVLTFYNPRLPWQR